MAAWILPAISLAYGVASDIYRKWQGDVAQGRGNEEQRKRKEALDTQYKTMKDQINSWASSGMDPATIAALNDKADRAYQQAVTVNMQAIAKSAQKRGQVKSGITAQSETKMRTGLMDTLLNQKADIASVNEQLRQTQLVAKQTGLLNLETSYAGGYIPAYQRPEFQTTGTTAGVGAGLNYLAYNLANPRATSYPSGTQLPQVGSGTLPTSLSLTTPSSEGQMWNDLWK